MTEAFACGTAAVITPVGHVKSRRGNWDINHGQTGPVAAKLREVLLDLQHGRVPDTHGWMKKIVGYAGGRSGRRPAGWRVFFFGGAGRGVPSGTTPSWRPLRPPEPQARP